MALDLRLTRERELAHPTREPLACAFRGFELRLDAVRVSLAPLRVVDGVPRVVHDAVEMQRGATVFVDPPVKEVPARLTLGLVRSTNEALPNLGRKVVRIASGIVVVRAVRGARQGDVPGPIELVISLRLRRGGAGEHDGESE